MSADTVSSWAQSTGLGPDDLLAKMQEAGLAQKSVTDSVSDADKQKCIAFLQKPKKATLSLKARSGAPRKAASASVVRRRRSAGKTGAQPPPPARTLVDDAERRRQDAVARRKQEQQAKKDPPPPPVAPATPAPEPEVKPASRPSKKKAVPQNAAPTHSKKKALGKSQIQTAMDDRDWHKRGTSKMQDIIAEAEAERKAERETEEQKKRRKINLDKLHQSNPHAFKRPDGKAQRAVHVTIADSNHIKDLAHQMSAKSADLAKWLKKNTDQDPEQELDRDTATLLVEGMGHLPAAQKKTLEDEVAEAVESTATGDAQPRPPVVTVMGHVDHGKTSLLDYIRKSGVADGEAGGITQHIGAYSAQTPQGTICFLDTPGHAAFSAMRARGAGCTDIVVLVVAADDGVMPQTKEAVEHAQAAGVPIIVAVNKMDLDDAAPDKAIKGLMAMGVVPEAQGGDVQFVPLSAKTGKGVDALLEAINLQAEVSELRAPTKGAAQGVIVEARLDQGRGTICTALVRSGTLRQGDTLLAGTSFGRVRSMTDDRGQRLRCAGPSVPVEVLGFGEVPDAGTAFVVMANERKARDAAQQRSQDQRKKQLEQRQALPADPFAAMDAPEQRSMSLLVRADVQGSVEAIVQSLESLGNDEVSASIALSGVGGITESDINLASTTGSTVLGFNVRASGAAKRLAEREGIELRYYSVIYELVDDIKQGLSGMLSPETKERIIGIAEVKDRFQSPKLGTIAGCIVAEGLVAIDRPIRVLRDQVVIYEGRLESLRRFKDDVAEVRSGTECGIGVKDYDDVQVGDQIEVFETVETERKL